MLVQESILSAAADLTPWIALTRVRGLGCVGFKKLAVHFADPTRAFNASAAELHQIAGLDEAALEGLVRFNEWAQAESEVRAAQDAGVDIVAFTDARYPARLRTIVDPPPVLFARGEIRATDERAVAVVGSRSASDYGRRVTGQICRGLATWGFTVVSGMARGIDGVAHESALDSGGRTIAVLGSGVDRIYPSEHDRLFERIARQGSVISELPLGTRPAAFNFPARNRIISGLSLGVVVVEATEKSGSLITAALALEQNREVFAVPGEVGSSRSRGTHGLIRQGAKLVECAEDIVEEIAPQLARKGGSPPARELPAHSSEEMRKVWCVLRDRALQIDEVIETSGLSSAQVSRILLDLELQGFLRQLPGKRYAAET